MVDNSQSEDEFMDALSDVEEVLEHRPVISVSLEEAKFIQTSSSDEEILVQPEHEDSQFAEFQTLPLDNEFQSVSSFQTVPTSPTHYSSVEFAIRPANTVPITPALTKVMPIQINSKPMSEFSGLVQHQELLMNSGSNQPVWVMKFSPDGKYLAIGGDYPKIQLFWSSVLGSGMLMPGLELVGHTQSILDISWSKSCNFLLSASADSFVHLWSVDKSEPVSSFSHANFVTFVSFHPTVSD